MASSISRISDSLPLGDIQSFLSAQLGSFDQLVSVLASNPTLDFGDLLGSVAGAQRQGNLTLNLSGADLIPLIERAVGDLDISRLEGVAMSLPPEFSGPDATGEIATGGFSITRSAGQSGEAHPFLPHSRHGSPAGLDRGDRSAPS
jgi:hypothetical protein